MTPEECPHGLEPAWCSVCKHGPTRPPVIKYGGPFQANYAGTCGECREPIAAGDWVAHRFADEDGTGYVHLACIP